MKSALVLVVILLVFSSCKHNPVDAPLKNPREYAWTIDTLAYPESYQTKMRDIWGSSPRDVYVVGHTDRSMGVMWHFDGTKWADVKLNVVQGGNLAGAMDLSAIVGISPSNIVCVGEHIFNNYTPPPNFLDSSLIIRFDGHQWVEEKTSRGRVLWSLAAPGQNDIWTCGRAGTLYHFDGTSWKNDTVPLVAPAGADYSLWSITSNPVSHESYMIAYIDQIVPSRITRYFFENKGQRWVLLDSSAMGAGLYENKFGESGLWMSPNGTLYSYGSNIFRWTGTSWLKVFNTTSVVAKMAGTTDGNIFAVGDFGEVLHFDGNDWYQFSNINYPDINYASAWTDGTEVFLVGFTSSFPQKTIIVHGK
jgi:hypothetical protein